ncbi:beta-ketoacyl-[acyl-carrier-protein] synthase family protein [Nocardia pseudobrasiliensis]|nr:beta-ketoacyl synthase N-terminal-like domain-containing protein [Nocardia pseudobrasiliensis]
MAVTGLGFTLPGLVTTVDGFWERIRGGHPALRPCTVHDRITVMAGQLGHDPVVAGLNPAHEKKYSRDILATMASIGQALEDAGLPMTDPGRIAIAAASSRGPMAWWSRRECAGTGIGSVINGLAGTPASMAAIHFGIRGMVSTLSSACVSGAHALRLAAAQLADGEADAVVVAGHDFPLTAEFVATYCDPATRVISVGRTVETSIRPYDIDRDGTTFGEGAVSLIVERESDARARGARIYACISAIGNGNEADHPTSMDKTGVKTEQLARRVVQRAGLSTADIDYVCGHGTGTRLNDLSESRAVRGLLGEQTDVPLTSVKPVFGHLLGASTLINVAATALMIRHQTVAPTANCRQPDPECGLDPVSGAARSRTIDAALSLGFSIGGNTSVIAMTR